MPSTLYSYGSTGPSMFVRMRLPNESPEKIRGEEAKRIHDSADFICVSALGGFKNEWILHHKFSGPGTIPHRQTGDYAYLVAECEKIANRSDLIILYC